MFDDRASTAAGFATPRGGTPRHTAHPVALTVAAFAAVAGLAGAGVTSWANPAGGNWNDPLSWSAGVPNSPATTAEIDLAGAYVVSANISAIVEELLVTNPDVTVNILNSITLTVASDTVSEVALVNNASIVVNSNQGVSVTQLVVGDSDSNGWVGPEIGMSGEVVLNVGPGNGDLNDAVLTIVGGVHAADHTVRGKGRVNGTFTNEGEILADRVGDEVRISGDVTQASGGLVRATAGGFLGIGDGGVLRGGTLVTDTDGKIRFQAGTGTLAGNAHNLGLIEVTNGQTMRLDAGGIVNDGAITLNSNAGTLITTILVATTDPILGSGAIDLNVGDGNGDLSDALLTTEALTATNGPLHSIIGKGRVAGSWFNDGTIEADRDGQELRIQAHVVQSATGVVGASNNGVLGLGDGGHVSGGTIITSTGGSVQATSGTGTVDGGLVNQGDMGVRNGQTLAIGDGGIVNNGVISVNSNQSTSITDLAVIADAAISGTGRVDLNVSAGNGDFNDARLITAAGVTATIGPDQSVTGKGRVTGAFINDGAINADRPGQDIRVSGTIDQSPAGTVMGTNGGFAVLENAAIVGGLLDGVGGGATLVGGGVNSVSGVTSLGAAGIRNSGGLSLLAGGLTNHGVFAINSQPGTDWAILTVAESTTIDGAGRIELNIADSNGDFNDAQLNTAADVTATHGADHTIAGKGRLAGSWINHGTIAGDRAGQDLQLVGSFDQPAGGVIRGDNGGFAVLVGADVTGGFFDSANGGAVHAASAGNSVSGVTNLGQAGVRNGGTLNINAGGLTNDGTLTLNTQPSTDGTIINIMEPATIDGVGAIVLNLANSNADYNDCQINAISTATNAQHHTIAGKGRLSGDWVNRGTIAADRPAQDLQIASATVTQSATGVIRGDDADVSIFTSTIAGGAFDSSLNGSVQFAGGGISQVGGVRSLGRAGLRSGAEVQVNAAGLTNDGDFTVNSNQGVDWTIFRATDNALVDGAGVFRLGLSPFNIDFNDCQVGANDGFMLTFGPDQTLAGRGRLFGQVIVLGVLSPGTDSATAIDTIFAVPIGIENALTMASTTEFHVQATAEEVNDRVTATVPVHLDGTLVFTPIDGFDPPRPTRYTVLTAPSYTGQFHTLVYNGVVPEGGVFKVVYEETEVIAAITCKADIAAPIGLLDLSDIVVFTQLFLINSPLVDLAEPFGLLDLADVIAYIQEFLAGCG